MNIEKKVQLQLPKPEDGTAVWQLIRQSGGLDLNSTYCYIMLCDMFRETCVVAHGSEGICGFMSSYRRPDQPDTLFVWQVAVAASQRGQGLGSGMLRNLLQRPSLADIRYVEATIGPGNEPSQKIFLRLADDRRTECHISPKYGPELFPFGMNHETELLYRVGPL